jgi:prepilin-type processing-associated H-X9-DG protein
MKTMKSEKRSGAFTVIELLAVIAMVGLLGFLFLPVFEGARADARTAQCRENLQQIGKAVPLYAMDHDGKFPGCQHEPPSWVGGLEAYCNKENFVCAEGAEELADLGKPTTRRVRGGRNEWSYALNDFLTPHPYGARNLDFSKIATVPSPWETMLFGEAAGEYRRYDHFHFADEIENGFTPAAFSEQVEVEGHGSAANYLFVDGRVEELGWTSGARPKLNFPKSRFVHPAGESRTQQQMARR